MHPPSRRLPAVTSLGVAWVRLPARAAGRRRRREAQGRLSRRPRRLVSVAMLPTRSLVAVELRQFHRVLCPGKGRGVALHSS